MVTGEDWLSRTRLLLGDGALTRLSQSHVLVVGLGGVGAYAAEMICRGGVGAMTIVDGDAVQPSNRNRQLPALKSTEGMRKAHVMADRLRDVNPALDLTAVDAYLRDEQLEELVSHRYDYVVDAIDTLSPKVFLIHNALRSGNRVVSSMGAGGKTDPLQVRVDDIAKTHHCRLAKMLRKRLHRLGIRQGFDAVYSPEDIPPHAVAGVEDEQNKKSMVGTISYMPALFGIVCASVVLRALAAGDGQPDQDDRGPEPRIPIDRVL